MPPDGVSPVLSHSSMSQPISVKKFSIEDKLTIQEQQEDASDHESIEHDFEDEVDYKPAKKTEKIEAQNMTVIDEEEKEDDKSMMVT